MKSDGNLSSFLHSVLSKTPCSDLTSTSSSSLWPIPIPYPEAFEGPYSLGLWKKRRLCLQIVILDWLSLGRPVSAPSFLRLGRRLARRQWKVVRLLEDLADDKNSVDEVDAQGMGRTAVKSETYDEEINALHRAVSVLGATGSYGARKVFPSDGFSEQNVSGDYGYSIGNQHCESFVAAKAIEADRLVFGSPPSFDPLPYLDSKTAAMYQEPSLFHRKEFGPMPNVTVRATVSNKLALYRKLASTGRLIAVSAAEVKDEVASGLFCVPKDLSRDRLIMDSRPPNSREIGLNTWTHCAASATNLAGIELGDEQRLLLSGQDVKDFYYQFIIGRSRARRNLLKGWLSHGELVDIFGAEAELPRPGGYVCLNTMAMGDICACEFSQGSHLGLLLQSSACTPEELVQHRKPFPRGPFALGVVIDDMIMMEVVSRRWQLGQPTLADSRMESALAAYSESGLPVNPNKAFPNADSATFWGVSVDGEKGTVRPNPHRLWPLIVVTWRIAALGVATISLLESVAGSWISIFTARRRFLSFMELIFDAIHCGAPRTTVIRLSPALKDELLSFCVMGPMVVVNLRAKTLGVIHATDASDWGMAAVAAEIPRPLAREAFRWGLNRSSWSRLLPPGKAWLKTKGALDFRAELPGDEDFYDTHPLWELLARVPSYVEQWRRPHKKRIHINIGELAAHLREESRIGLQFQSVRVCHGLDSQVSLGALVKGRAASKSLNSLLRGSLPNMLGCDLYAAYGFFPSGIHRADGPTRNAAPSKPDVSEPFWWSLENAEQLAAFDDWISQQASFGNEADDVDFSELGYKAPLSLKDPREVCLKKEIEMQDPPGPVSLGETAESGEALLYESTLSAEVVAMLESIPKHQVWWPKGSKKQFDRPGALDLYSGVGGVARNLLKQGCPFVITYDWKRSSAENLLDPKLQQFLLTLVGKGAFSLVGSAVICSSFSKAVTPQVRSPRHPKGIPWMRESMRSRVADGNAHADFNAKLLNLCRALDILFWLENPDSSYL